MRCASLAMAFFRGAGWRSLKLTHYSECHLGTTVKIADSCGLTVRALMCASFKEHLPRLPEKENARKWVKHLAGVPELPRKVSSRT
jgi:hypothetical protein